MTIICDVDIKAITARLRNLETVGLASRVGVVQVAGTANRWDIVVTEATGRTVIFRLSSLSDGGAVAYLDKCLALEWWTADDFRAWRDPDPTGLDLVDECPDWAQPWLTGLASDRKRAYLAALLLFDLGERPEPAPPENAKWADKAANRLRTVFREALCDLERQAKASGPVEGPDYGDF